MPKLIEQPRYSCALGAMQSVVAIKRGVPILHSGPGCANKITKLIVDVYKRQDQILRN